MAVSFWVGRAEFPVGSASFLNSFFSTILVRLEGGVRGSAFPLLARFYATGRIVPADALAVLEELARVRERLSALAPAQVVWDSDDPAARPPWADQHAPTTTSLAVYFWTMDGKDLFQVLREAAQHCADQQSELVIR